MVLITQATAEIREGIIIRTEIDFLGNGISKRLFVLADTTGNRIPNTYLEFPDPTINALSRNLEAFVERGMTIIFDDEGILTFANGNSAVSGDNTISIDGVNMIDLFPAERARFRFAAQAYDRQRSN